MDLGPGRFRLVQVCVHLPLIICLFYFLYDDNCIPTAKPKTESWSCHAWVWPGYVPYPGYRVRMAHTLVRPRLGIAGMCAIPWLQGTHGTYPGITLGYVVGFAVSLSKGKNGNANIRKPLLQNILDFWFYFFLWHESSRSY